MTPTFLYPFFGLETTTTYPGCGFGTKLRLHNFVVVPRFTTRVKRSLWFQSTLHWANIAFALERKYIKVQTYVAESVPFTFIIVIIFLCPQRNFGRHIVIALSVRPSVRPSRFRVPSISPIFLKVGIPNLVCGYILGWRSVAYHFRVTVTLTLTSDLVFRIIVSGAYLILFEVGISNLVRGYMLG